MTDTLHTELSPLDRARRDFRADLLEAGLLIGSSVPGIYGRSAVFEAILTGLDRVLTEMVAPLGATALRFPPVYPRADFERTDYIASFPDLSGIVSSFERGDHERRVQRVADRVGEDDVAGVEPAVPRLAVLACQQRCLRQATRRRNLCPVP